MPDGGEQGDDATVPKSEERTTIGFGGQRLPIPPRMITTTTATLGLVLLVIGTNLPSVMLSGIGVAILVAIVVLHVVRTRRANDIGGTDGDALATKLATEYERDLRDTLDGYNLRGNYDDDDIRRSMSEYLSSIDRTGGHGND